MRLPLLEKSHLDLSPQCRDLYRHVYTNNVEELRIHVQRAPSSVNQQDVNGQTPLFLATSFNRVEIIDVLLASYCDVNVVDNDGNTALHEAVDKGHLSCVQKLISTGRCRVDTQNNQGETALMKALFYDYHDIAALLLNSGNASADITNNLGQSALLIGLQEGSHLAVDLLLRHGCDVTIVDTLGQSALYIAVHSPCNKTLDLARRLISAGYNLSIDKSWLLKEHKHNLFYNDEEFYRRLILCLQRVSHDALAGTNNYTNHDVGGKPRGTGSHDGPLPVLKTQTTSNGSPFSISPPLRRKIASASSKPYPVEQFNVLPFEEISSVQSESSVSVTLTRENSRRVCPVQNPAVMSVNTRGVLDDGSMKILITGNVPVPQKVMQSSAKQTTLTICEREPPRMTSTKSTPLTVSITSYDSRQSTEHSTERPSERSSVLRKRSVKHSIENSISALSSHDASCKRQINDLGVVSAVTDSRRKVAIQHKPSVRFNSQVHVIDYCRRQ